MVERKQLEDRLEDVINSLVEEKGLDYKKIENEVIRYLDNRNIFEGVGIFEKSSPLNTLSDQVLYHFTKALYNATSRKDVMPKNYYTDIEMEVYEGFKREEKSPGESIMFENILRINDNQWIGKISVQDLVQLYRNNRINYNPKTQRELNVETHRGTEIVKPTTFPKNIKQIREKMLSGDFFANTITFNIRKDGKEEVYYDDNVLIIEKGNLDVTDGWNRSLAMLEATLIDKKFNMDMEIRITHLTEEQAGRFIVQNDKQEKMSKHHTERLSVEKYETRIVNKLNENYRSDLKGKIATDDNAMRSGRAIVKFTTLTEAIKENFDIKTSTRADMTADYLIDFFNVIYDYFYETFEEDSDKNKLAKTEFAFVGYIAIASFMKDNKYWKDRLMKTLEKIDFNSFTEYDIIMPKSNIITKATVTKISNLFKDII